MNAPGGRRPPALHRSYKQAAIGCRTFQLQIFGHPKYYKLEGTAAYGCLLLAPGEGWWPSATWRALRALFSFRCQEGLLPIIFIQVVVVPDVIACSVLKLQKSYTPLWIQESLSYSLVYVIFVQVDSLMLKNAKNHRRRSQMTFQTAINPFFVSGTTKFSQPRICPIYRHI